MAAAIKGLRSRYRLATWRWQHLVLGLPSGLTVRIDSHSDWYVYKEVFLEGQYDAVIDGLLTKGHAPVVVDLGANVGFFALRLLDRWRRAGKGPIRLICVEGSSRTFARLARNVGAHAEAHFGLAGRRSGEGAMSRSHDAGMNSIIDRSVSLTRERVLFLDIAALAPSPIDLMKIDIEGAEEMFLESYPELLERTERVVIELHGGLCNVLRCRQLLTSAGLTRYGESDVLHRMGDISTVEVFSRSPAV